MPLLISK